MKNAKTICDCGSTEHELKDHRCSFCLEKGHTADNCPKERMNRGYDAYCGPRR